MRPSNISCLVSACTGAWRADRQQRTVEPADVVGRRRSPARRPGRGAAGGRAGPTSRRDARAQDGTEAAEQRPRRGCARAGSGQGGHASRLDRLHQRDDLGDDLVQGVRRGVDVDGAVGHHQRRGGAAGVDPVAGQQRLLGRGDVDRRPRRRGVRRGPRGRRSGRPSPARRAPRRSRCRGPRRRCPAGSPMIVALELQQPGAHLGDGADRADGGVDLVACGSRRPTSTPSTMIVGPSGSVPDTDLRLVRRAPRPPRGRARRRRGAASTRSSRGTSRRCRGSAARAGRRRRATCSTCRSRRVRRWRRRDGLTAGHA